MRKVSLSLAMPLAIALALPTFAQHIPPHSNDPHPPANQPAYQLPSPLSRPGVPGFPGAAHSNDPHFRRTEPQQALPIAPPAPRVEYPSVPRQSSRSTDTRPRAARAKASDERTGRKPRRNSLSQCYGNWDPGIGMSRERWQVNCRRLAAEGRLGG